MWEQFAPHWQACLEQAWKGYCEGSMPIGSVVVNGKGVIIAKGRNSAYDAGEQQIGQHRLAHAELNALLAANFSLHAPTECILYTSTEPCPLCIGAIVMANVKQIEIASRDPWCGSVDLLEASDYMRSQEVKVTGPEDRILEMILVGIQVEFHLRGDKKRASPLLDAWRAVVPEGVKLGEQLYRNREWQKLRSKKAPVETMCEFLERTLKEANLLT